jgi:asparagine synthase (glutamine-hydrolysing)
MANQDQSLVMVFNGEIYNYPALRQFCEGKGSRFRSNMDGEVILHLWEMEGPDCLARLNGIFAVAMASTRSGEVVLARDPLGVKPLVYAVDRDNSLWFASEMSALIAAGAPLGQSDVVALAQFLTFLWVPDPRTPLSGARTVPPGTALRWTPDAISTFTYSDPLVPVDGADPIDPEDAVHSTRERLSEAVSRQLLSDVSIGLMASGGVDSGLLWWAAQDDLVQAYTITWKDNDGIEGLDEDRRAVAQLESRFGTKVDYLSGENAQDILPLSGDLFADPAYGLTRLIARAARDQGHKVLLSGQGGDELFAGYRRHTVAPLIERVRIGSAAPVIERALQYLPARRLGVEYVSRLVRAAGERTPFRRYMQLCSYSTARERAMALGTTEGEVSDDVVWQRHQEVFERLPPNLSFLRKVMALDLAVYLPGLGLAYVDRAGMEFGVEIRVPWLDLDFLRWTLTLPDDALAHHGRGKWLTRELAARELGAEIAHRPKRGFAAPVSSLRPDDGDAGQRGFRQGAYFHRASRLLGHHLNDRTEVQE